MTERVEGKSKLHTRRSRDHHWIIESPNGATSRGICNGCGLTRHFLNSTPEQDPSLRFRDGSTKKDKKKIRIKFELDPIAHVNEI